MHSPIPETQSLNFLPVLLVSIQVLDALGASEADLVVDREAISDFRTYSLLLAEFAHSYLTFCSDTLMKCQKQHIRYLI